MKKQSLTVLIFSALLLPLTVSAADGTTWNGSVKLGARAVEDNGNSAKFQEYRDLDDDIIGKVRVDGYTDGYHFEIRGKNLGLDDQSYLLKGGKYEQFKYRFDYDETPHNYTFDAKTPYSGIGGNLLTYDGALPAEANWSLFDYSIERKKYGGEMEFSLGTPFYVNAEVSRLDTEGTKPIVLSDRFAERSELPEPIDHITDNLSLRTGYRGESYFVELSGRYSSFENDNKYLTWESPITAGDHLQVGLAPEHDFKQLAAKFVWKNLPLMSTFAVDGAYSQKESDLVINPELLAANPSYTQTFSGNVKNTEVSAALTTRPFKALDTKLYLNYAKRDNTPSYLETDEANSAQIFGYEKDNAGIELGYRLSPRNRLTLGYDYVNLDRINRQEFENNTDHSFFARLRNSSLDFMAASLRYRHLERNFDTQAGTEVAVADFDATERNQDEVKLTLDFFTFDHLDIGVEYTYGSIDYEADELFVLGVSHGIRGREHDERNALYLDLGVRLPREIKVSGFAGYENRRVDSIHNNSATNTAPYSQDTRDYLWSYGLNGRMPLLEDRLKLMVNWEHQKSVGESNFGIDETLEDIGTVADYTKKLLEAKAVYAVNRQLEVILGYMYEKYIFRDLQYIGYDFTASGNSFLSGAYAFQDYENNVGYLLLNYHFNL
jgi:MtrB/PioB family decaheme-associated outer membrane protein